MSIENKDGRVNTFANLDDLSDFKSIVKPIDSASKTATEKLATELGFVSRERPKNRGTRMKTGRNIPLTLRVTKEAWDRFYALADEMSLPLGEVFDQGIKALIESRKKTK